MSLNTTLVLISIAFFLALALVLLAIKRIQKEGVSVGDRQHFIRSADEVRRQLAEEQMLNDPANSEPESEVKTDRPERRSCNFSGGTELSVEEAVEQLLVHLKAEGFSLLTDMDLKPLLVASENAVSQHLLIVYKQSIAVKALAVNPSAGLLPCHVTIRQHSEDGFDVEISNPMMQKLSADDEGLEGLLIELDASLKKVLDSIES